MIVSAFEVRATEPLADEVTPLSPPLVATVKADYGGDSIITHEVSSYTRILSRCLYNKLLVERCYSYFNYVSICFISYLFSII
jgi:hypothetical protein